jgi:hypothetical protein
VEVAFDLIGAWFVVDRSGQRVEARIVEAGAHGGDEDLASHAMMYWVRRKTLNLEAGALSMQFAYGINMMTNLAEPGYLSRGMGTTPSDTLSPLTAETGTFVSAEPGNAEDRADARWRLFAAGSRFVSRHRRGEPVIRDDLQAIIDDLPRQACSSDITGPTDADPCTDKRNDREDRRR